MELRICSACRQVRPGLTTCPGCRGPLTLADETLFLGETFGKYRLDAVLGAGGMGVVYRAIHATLNRPAALKIVLPQLDDATFQKRFLREAQVLAELKHPTIVEVYDFDVSAWGSPYYVMEYLHGATLGSLVRSRHAPLPAALIAAVLADVAAGLAFAHRKGVVHRDLKPDNLYVAAFDGRAVTKILDFGIAKVLAAGQETATHLTATGAVVGTPNYLAPEQLLGRDVGPKTDQYALALIVGELMTGRPMRAGKTLGEILREEIARPLVVERLPADVPDVMRAALERATQPEPAARFADVAAFLAALRLPPAEDGPGKLAEAVAQARAAEPATAAVGRSPTATVGGPATGTAADAGPAATGTVVGGAATGTVVAERVAPPSTRPRRRSGLWVGAVSIGLAVLVGAWLLRRPTAPGATSGAGSGSALGSLLRHRRDLPMPPDVTAILGWKDDTLVVQGGGAVYLLLKDGSQASTRIPLGAGERVIGPAPDGDVWLRDGARIVRLDPVKQDRQTVVERLSLPPASGDVGPGGVQVSPGERFVAVVGPRTIDVCEVRRPSCAKRFAAPRDGGADVVVSLTEKYLVTVQGRHELVAYRLPDGARLASAPVKEAKIRALAVLDDLDLAAVSGWFDHVDVHALAGGRHVVTIPCPEGANGLAWIGDHPTLMMGGARGLTVWRPDATGPAGWGAGAHDSAGVLAAGGGVASLDGGRHVLSLLDYGDLPAPRALGLGKVPLWGMAAAGDGKRLYVGGSDGTMHVVDVDAGKDEPVSLHTDGITDVVVRGDHLASTSDDKTLAVWQLPKMSVIWRSKAHAFLVNQMWLAGEPASLWTSSSDGTVKRWGWPQAEEQESLDLRRMTGRKVALQALWVSAAGDRVLAGTWQNSLAVVRRGGSGAWKAELWPVASQALYRVAEVPGLDAVLLTGLNPYGVYLYDLERGRLDPLRSLGHVVYTAVPGTTAGEAYVLGDGVALRYQLARRPDGRIAYGVTPRLRTELGVALTAALVPGRGLLAAGTNAGEVMLLDPRLLAGQAIVQEVLP